MMILKKMNKNNRKPKYVVLNTVINLTLVLFFSSFSLKSKSFLTKDGNSVIKVVATLLLMKVCGLTDHCFHRGDSDPAKTTCP